MDVQDPADIDYSMIRAVVRHRRVIPVIAALAVLLVLLLTAWRVDSGLMAVGAVVAATVLWVLMQLMVEIVVVVADTLLPR